GGIVQLLLPMEGRRAVVGQQFSRDLGVDRFGELPGLLQVRFGGFTPEHVGEGGIGQAARNRRLNASAEVIEPFASPSTGQEGGVARVDVAQQEASAVGV